MSLSQNNAKADNTRAGRAYAPNQPFSGSLPGMLLSHLMVVRFGPGSKQGYPAPAVGAANNIALAQAIAGAGLALINGALATGGIASMDVPRVPTMISSNAGDTTQTVTLRGYDTVGRAVTETRTLNGTVAVPFQKAFSKVLSATVSAALAGNLTIGTTNIFGLPVRIRVGDVLSAKVGNAVPEAGTIVAGDLTTPSAITGDPLGTFLSGTAPNGANVYTLTLNVEDRTENAFGTQFAG